jgi:hypothetical protein
MIRLWRLFLWLESPIINAFKFFVSAFYNPSDDPMHDEVREILTTVGEIMREFAFIGPRFNILSWMYRVPVGARSAPLLVSDVLRIPLDTETMPDGVLLNAILDPRFLDALKAGLKRDVRIEQANLALTTTLLTESASLRPHKADVEIWIEIEVNPLILRRIPRRIDYDGMASRPSTFDDMYLCVPIGQSVTRFIWVDLHSEAIHILLSGVTQSGKSTWIHFFIRWLCENYSSDYLKFRILDCKFGVEFNSWRYGDVDRFTIYNGSEREPMMEFFQQVFDMSEERYGIFHSNECSSYREYDEFCRKNGKDNDLPFVVVIIDEYAEVLRVGGKAAGNTYQSLAARVAASGIHLILCTQRPSVDVVTGSIKVNHPTRIGFSFASTTDSSVLYGLPEEELLNTVSLGCPGRGFVMVKDTFTEFQSPFYK